LPLSWFRWSVRPLLTRRQGPCTTLLAKDYTGWQRCVANNGVNCTKLGSGTLGSIVEIMNLSEQARILQAVRSGYWPREGATMIKAGIAAALGCLGLGIALAVPAQAAPGQNCTTPEWVTDMGIPIGTRTTCFNPDGSYQVCTSLGTAGNGPGTCINYPAAPAPNPGGLMPINPPVPGGPPPPQ
jgi:hypothetical protein